MSRYVFQHHIRSSISRGIYTSRGTLATPPALLRCPAHKTLPRRYPPRPARCLPVKWSGGRNWLFPVKIFKYRNIFLCWLLLSTAHWNTSLRGGTNLISLNYNNTGEIFLKMRAEKWHKNLQKHVLKTIHKDLASFSLQCFLIRIISKPVPDLELPTFLPLPLFSFNKASVAVMMLVMCSTFTLGRVVWMMKWVKVATLSGSHLGCWWIRRANVWTLWR